MANRFFIDTITYSCGEREREKVSESKWRGFAFGWFIVWVFITIFRWCRCTKDFVRVNVFIRKTLTLRLMNTLQFDFFNILIVGLVQKSTQTISHKSRLLPKLHKWIEELYRWPILGKSIPLWWILWNENQMTWTDSGNNCWYFCSRTISNDKSRIYIIEVSRQRTSWGVIASLVHDVHVFSTN